MSSGINILIEMISVIDLTDHKRNVSTVSKIIVNIEFADCSAGIAREKKELAQMNG